MAESFIFATAFASHLDYLRANPQRVAARRMYRRAGDEAISHLLYAGAHCDNDDEHEGFMHAGATLQALLETEFCLSGHTEPTLFADQYSATPAMYKKVELRPLCHWAYVLGLQAAYHLIRGKYIPDDPRHSFNIGMGKLRSVALSTLAKEIQANE